MRKANLLSETIDSTKRKLIKLLDEEEKVWAQKQEQILDETLTKSFENAQLFEEKANQWIRDAKEKWNGPITSPKELKSCFGKKRTEKEIKLILKTEIRIKKFLSPRDAATRKDLYKLNNLDINQLKFNLLTILSTPYQKCEMGDFPDNSTLTSLIRAI